MFGTSTKSYLGIDIGTSTLKLVELSNQSGRPKLMTYGYLEQTNDIIRSDTPEAKKKIVESLNLLMSKSQTGSKKVVAALPSYTVFTSIINLPLIEKREELASAVRWEAKKFVPMPIEEMILDWKILGDKSSTSPVPSTTPEDQSEVVPPPLKDRTMRIMITAAPKNLVDRYVEIFKSAGLSLVSLETEALALERSLVGKDPSPILIMDIGASATTILVVLNSVPLINRSIDVGGAQMTRAIAEGLGISLDRAEQFKRDFGVNAGSAAPETVYPAKLETLVNAMMNEVRYVLNLYQNQSDQKIEKMILTGGSAFLANLPELISKRFGYKSFIGDPWARVISDPELTEVLKEVGPAMSVAVGLAMREIM